MTQPRRSQAKSRTRKRAEPAFEEALERSARSARAAASQALGSLHALLEAASLLASGAEPSQGGRLARGAALLGELAARLAGSGEGHLLAALTEILDAEVARWRVRARDDADARLVLRAFLALRELLSQAGARPSGPRADAGSPARARPATARPRRQVQRVHVQG
jgi:hypothetical protein